MKTQNSSLIPLADKSARVGMGFSIWMLLAVPSLIFINCRGTSDMNYWTEWAEKMLKFGPVQGYCEIAMDYPPLASQFLGLATWLGASMGLGMEVSIKISLLVALWTTILVFWTVTRHFGATVLTYAALELHSAIHGYLDIYYASFLLLALTALAKERFTAFTICYCCAGLVKWQPLIIAPFLAMHVIRAQGARVSPGVAMWRLGLSTVAPILAVALLMVLIFGSHAIGHALYATFRGGSHRALSLFALNLPWIFSHGLEYFMPGQFQGVGHEPLYLNGGKPGILKLGSEQIHTLTRMPFMAVYLFALYSVWRSELSFVNTIRGCVMGCLSYFILSTGVHENHLFLVVLLALYLFAISAVPWELPVILALMMNGNLLLFYGWDGRGLKFDRALGGSLDVALCAAVVNVVVATHVFCLLRRQINASAPAWEI